MLEKVLIKEFILHCWGDWKGIVTKVEKNKICYLHRSSILNINTFAHKDVIRDYNKQNLWINYFHPSRYNVE